MADIMKAMEIMATLNGVEISQTGSGYRIDVTDKQMRKFLDGYLDASKRSEGEAQAFREHAYDEAIATPILDKIDPEKLDQNPDVENIIQADRKSIRDFWKKHSEGENS